MNIPNPIYLMCQNTIATSAEGIFKPNIWHAYLSSCPRTFFKKTNKQKKKHPPMNATFIFLCHDKVHYLKNKTNTKKPPMNATFISLCHDKVHFLRSALRWAFAGIACQASMAISTPASHAWYVCNSFQMKLT